MSVKGMLEAFHDRGDSGQEVERDFCPERGSPKPSGVSESSGPLPARSCRPDLFTGNETITFGHSQHLRCQLIKSHPRVAMMECPSSEILRQEAE